MADEIKIKDYEKKLKQWQWGIAIELQEALKRKLTREHGKDIGALQGSIRGRVVDNGVEISMHGCGENLEFGTAPHSVPVEELKGWARRKLGDENLAYAVANAIRKRGTRPYPFIRTTYHQDLIPIITKNFRETLGKDFELTIKVV